MKAEEKGLEETAAIRNLERPDVKTNKGGKGLYSIKIKEHTKGMTGSERRAYIIEQIQNSESPVSGIVLAKQCQVSRQVIVQDIALLRMAGYDILSTNRGYILYMPDTASRIFKVKHTDEQLEEELNLIVDLGGYVVNVFVNHRVYGQLKAELGIHSRKMVKTFLKDIESGVSSPLKNVTSGYHYHEVEADNEETLDEIEERLREKGFLVEG